MLDVSDAPSPDMRQVELKTQHQLFVSMRCQREEKVVWRIHSRIRIEYFDWN